MYKNLYSTLEECEMAEWWPDFDSEIVLLMILQEIAKMARSKHVRRPEELTEKACKSTSLVDLHAVTLV